LPYIRYSKNRIGNKVRLFSLSCITKVIKSQVKYILINFLDKKNFLIVPFGSSLRNVFLISSNITLRQTFLQKELLLERTDSIKLELMQTCMRLVDYLRYKDILKEIGRILNTIRITRHLH